MHGLFYTPEAEEARRFAVEKLGLQGIDVGDGWLIFKIPKADFGFHPTAEGEQGAYHDISFFTSDLDGTMEACASRGVEFSEVEDAPWGRLTRFEMPGGLKAILYQPRYDLDEQP